MTIALLTKKFLEIRSTGKFLPSYIVLNAADYEALYTECVKQEKYDFAVGEQLMVRGVRILAAWALNKHRFAVLSGTRVGYCLAEPHV